jgi:putative ABC transport system substrate-binding protein
LPSQGAQSQTRTLRVGFVGLGGEATDAPNLAAFRAGLEALGPVDGVPIEIESRQAAGDPVAAAAAVQELARRPVGVFIAQGPATARIMHRGTTIPVVAIGLTNADRDLHETLARPGGRVTGIALFGEDIADKRLDLLRELIPNTKTVGVIHNLIDRNFEFWGARTADAGRRASVNVIQVGLRSTAAAEIADKVSRLQSDGGTAVIVLRDFVTSAARDAIISETKARGLATISEIEGFVQAGALASFGPDLPALFRRAAGFAHQIIRGANPANTPIEAPTRFRFQINVAAARQLAIKVTSEILARADEIIE